MSEQINDIAARVDREAAKIESMALAVVGRLASWIAPVPVAVMTARAISQIFGLPLLWSTITSAAFELVGMSASSLWLSLRTYNRTKRKSDPVASERLSLVSMIVYFVADFLIVLAITLTELTKTGDRALWTAILFPVLSVIGVLVLNLRVEHYDRLAAIERDKAERRAKVGKGKQKKPAPMVIGIMESPETRKDALLDIWRADPNITQANAAKQLGVKRSTVGNYYRELAKAGKVVKQNGSGYEVQK